MTKPHHPPSARYGLPIDPDAASGAVVAAELGVTGRAEEIPRHRHRKDQLVFAERGAVTCSSAAGIWIVPPGCGAWIPGGVEHSNEATPNARLFFLFVEPGSAPLPDHCCTLGLSPMLREMIKHLCGIVGDERRGDRLDRLAAALLDELALMPARELNLPYSDHPKIRKLIDRLTARPDDRSRLDEWATRLAMSERSLTRLMIEQTGMTFGRWRQRLHLLVALRELAAGASVQQVSGLLGYESVTAFITMFRKAVGVTPARYFDKQGESLQTGPDRHGGVPVR